MKAQAQRWRGVVAAVAMAATLATPAAAAVEEPFQVTQFGIPDAAPLSITAGPDGAMWFTAQPSTIGRITTAGEITRYPLVRNTPGGSLGELVSGADGALWVADCATIKRITTAGVSTEFPLPAAGCATHITAGPDGALWFAGRRRTIDEREVGLVGRITTAGAITEFPTYPGTRHVGTITTGPDSALWFREFGYPPNDTSDQHFTAMVRMTTEGSVTRHVLPSGSCPESVTAGPDGAVWFSLMCRGTIGRLTTNGAFSEFRASGGIPQTVYGLTVGPDRALWYVLGDGGIGRMTMDGAFTRPPASSGIGPLPRDIVAGPDGAIWFAVMNLPQSGPPSMDGMQSNPYSGYIARMTVPAPTPPADVTPASVTVTSPADGAAFSLGQVVKADYSCSDPSGVQNCAGSVPSGAAIDTSEAGAYTFVVNTVDQAGNTGTKSVSYNVLAGYAEAKVEGGGTVTTDPGGMGATTEAPVQTSITAPPEVSGTLSVKPRTTETPEPTGFGLFGEEVVLEGPVATASSPYQVTFTVDETALGGIAPSDVQVFRNGVALTGCTHPTAAVPDPCIVSRGFAPGGSGDALVTVRTSRFSTWSLGRLDYDLAGPFQPVDAAPAVNTTKAGSTIPVKFKLGGDKGLNVFVDGYPKSGTAGCASTATDEIEQTVSETSATLSYDPVSTQYTYAWKTAKSMTGCRDLVLRFRDGSELRVLFNLR